MSSRTEALRAKIEKTFEDKLDQVLLGLQHRGLNLKDFNFKESQDVVQKVGRRVLERAEMIRQQVAERPYSPAWLKDITLTPKKTTEQEPELDAHPAEASASMTEATVSQPAEDMLASSQEPKKSKRKKTTKGTK
ncbi:MAG TPA: hypothetical protein VM432_09815 [Bdellovibrionales bacterium]|nr:hypothetical protein [Bdellovibrionales bacterium]